MFCKHVYMYTDNLFSYKVLPINNDNAVFKNNSKCMVLSQVIQSTKVNKHETMSDKGTVRTSSLILETD